MPIDTIALQQIILRRFKRKHFDALLTETFDRGLERFSSDAGFELQVIEVLQVLSREGGLEKLIIAASDARKDDELMKLRAQIETAAKANTGPSLDPFDAIWLRGSRPFINRRQFRINVQRLLKPNHSHVLLVRGGPRTGKSHSRWFLEHIANALGGLDYVLIDLKKLVDIKLDLSAYDLAEALNIRLKLGFPLSKADSIESRPFKVEPFMLHMESKLVEPGVRSQMLVFDGFGHIQLTSSCIEIIQRLAQMADETLPQKKLALVLLGYEGSLSPEIHPHVCQDRTCSFEEDDIISFVNQFYEFILKPVKPDLLITPKLVAGLLVQLMPELAKTPNVEALGTTIARLCMDQFPNEC